MSKVVKIAKFPYGHKTKWLILAFWILVLVLAAPLARKLSGAEQNDSSAWLPGSAESTKALNVQEKFQSSNTLLGIVVYERSSGITAQDRAAATKDTQAFAKINGVESKIIGPIPSKDGKALQTIVPINLGSEGWNKAPEVVDKIHDVASTPGVTVNITGPAGNAADSGKAFEGIDSTLLYGTILVVVVILLFTYRSPVLWILPLISAGLALTAAQAVIYLLAKHAGLTVNAQSAGILTVLVFGAGTDYALLLVARYREELRRHEDRHEAMAFALHRAGPAIIASAATVAAGMLCLLVAQMNSTMSLGPVNAIGIGVGLLAMLTLLPALLVIFGRWIFWPVKPAFGSPEPTKSGLWAKVGAGISHRPRIVWIVTALVLGAFAVGLTSLDAHGLTNKETFINNPSSVRGEEALAQHFPAGTGQPVVVVGNAEATTELKKVFADTDGISSVGHTGHKGRRCISRGHTRRRARQHGSKGHCGQSARPRSSSQRRRCQGRWWNRDRARHQPSNQS